MFLVFQHCLPFLSNYYTATELGEQVYICAGCYGLLWFRVRNKYLTRKAFPLTIGRGRTRTTKLYHLTRITTGAAQRAAQFLSN